MNQILMDKKSRDYPDVALVVADVENLKRNLLLFSQVKDLQIPTILVINMSDIMIRKGIEIDIKKLEKKLDTKIVLISSKKNEGFDILKDSLIKYKRLSKSIFLDLKKINFKYFENLQKSFSNESLYKLWTDITQDINFVKKDAISKNKIARIQQKEIIKRDQIINEILKSTYNIDISKATDLRSRIDRVLIHKFWGYIIFFFVLLLMFQSIYNWSSYPMDYIDSVFSSGYLLFSESFLTIFSESEITF